MSLSTDQARREFRWPISASVDIAAPPQRVWDTLAAPDSLIASHPFLAANPVSKWPGADSRDEVHYLNGVIYERRFRAWQEGAGFDLEIFHKGKSAAWVSWRITPADNGRTGLRITVYPQILERFPPVVRWLPHWCLVRPRLKAYLSSVVMGYEWFITKGAAVPRNQFGTHPWFSRD